MIRSDLDSLVPQLAREFAQARPFRHCVIDGFFDERFASQLAAEFPAFEDRYAKNEMGELGGKAVRTDFAQLGPAYQQLDAMLQSPEYRARLSRITGVDNLLYDPAYVGGGTHDNRHGQELDFHIDFNYHPQRRWHRRLNQIVFLNREWDPAWGGVLELTADPWARDEVETSAVVPLWNRCVIFETTETSWHGFDKIVLPPERQALSRRSIALYFYTKEAPATAAASHATVYIPRPLPPHIAEGRTLTADDVATITNLLTRRDGQLRSLYQREQEFTALLDGITQSPSFRIGRAITAPLRWLRGLRNR